MDAVSNARTVAAFTADSRVLRLFGSFLAVPMQKSRQAAVLGGVAYGSSQFLQLAPYSLAFWYAGTLVASGNLSFKARDPPFLPFPCVRACLVPHCSFDRAVGEF